MFAESRPLPVLVEEQDYVMREEKLAAATVPAPAPSPEPAFAGIHRELVPDEVLLLRYCAITFNAHRIHYDLPYATEREGYPALVINGGIPLVFLLELFRTHAHRAPVSVASRNLAPLYCSRPMRLCAAPAEPEWRLWAEDEAGRAALEVSIR